MSFRYDVNRIFYNDQYRYVRYDDEEDVAPSVFFNLVTSTAVQGVRKAKYFTLQLKAGPIREYGLTAGQNPQPVYIDTFGDQAGLFWALIYMPEGVTTITMYMGDNEGVASLYNPSSNVMASGFIKPNNEIQRIQVPLARNLNSGDQIILVLRDNIIQDWQQNARYRESNVSICCEFAVSF